MTNAEILKGASSPSSAKPGNDSEFEVIKGQGIAGALENREGTALQRALARFRERQKIEEAEMEFLRRGGADYTGKEAWSRMMTLIGRR